MGDINRRLSYTRPCTCLVALLVVDAAGQPTDESGVVIVPLT